MRADMAAAAKGGADAVECRLDFLDPPPTDAQLAGLLADAPVEVVVTNRPKREGGFFRGGEDDRVALLRRAAACGADFVDVELATPRDRWPDAKIICSHHDFAGCPRELDSLTAALEATPAAVNKLVFAAAAPQDALRALDVLRACKKPTIALAMGVAGLASRILAKKFGAFGTFAALRAGGESAPGQPTIEQFRSLYRWDAIGPGTAVYGVIGCPISHSMSPAVHNAAFAAAGVDAVYVPLRVEEGADNFNRFMDELLSRPWLDFAGLSVTVPHKENALARVGADDCGELARQIGAVNTITISPGGKLRGDNTDYAAAIDVLCAAMSIERRGLAGRTVAVIGAGGVARAIVAALVHHRADVTIYNRTVSRGERLAARYDCRAAPLGAAEATDAEIVINCTSVGMWPDVDLTPLEKIPASAKVVFDTVYNPPETRLLRLARQARCLRVSGLDMFVNQAARQFQIWTGKPAPADVMRKIVQARLRTGSPHH